MKVLLNMSQDEKYKISTSYYLMEIKAPKVISVCMKISSIWTKTEDLPKNKEHEADAKHHNDDSSLISLFRKSGFA